MIKNPEYKGKWTAPMIDNPEYKGVWKAARIPNPNYFTDSSPSKFEKMGGIGFELWTMQADILFDNIYIGHSESEAAKFTKETWAVKNAIEKALDDAEKPKMSDDVFDGDWKEDPVEFITQSVSQFVQLARLDITAAFKHMPMTGGSLVIGAFTTLALLGGLVSLLLAPAKPKAASVAKKPVAKKEPVKAVVVEEEEIVVEDAPVEETPRKRTTRRTE